MNVESSDPDAHARSPPSVDRRSVASRLSAVMMDRSKRILRSTAVVVGLVAMALLAAWLLGVGVLVAIPAFLFLSGTGLYLTTTEELYDKDDKKTRGRANVRGECSPAGPVSSARPRVWEITDSRASLTARSVPAGESRGRGPWWEPRPPVSPGVFASKARRREAEGRGCLARISRPGRRLPGRASERRGRVGAMDVEKLARMVHEAEREYTAHLRKLGNAVHEAISGDASRRAEDLRQLVTLSSSLGMAAHTRCFERIAAGRLELDP